MLVHVDKVLYFGGFWLILLLRCNVVISTLTGKEKGRFFNVLNWLQYLA